jgi:hypothetical protein
MDEVPSPIWPSAAAGSGGQAQIPGCHSGCLTPCILFYRVAFTVGLPYTDCPSFHLVDRRGTICKTSIPSSILGVASKFLNTNRALAAPTRSQPATRVA